MALALPRTRSSRAAALRDAMAVANGRHIRALAVAVAPEVEVDELVAGGRGERDAPAAAAVPEQLHAPGRRGHDGRARGNADRVPALSRPAVQRPVIVMPVDHGPGNGKHDVGRVATRHNRHQRERQSHEHGNPCEQGHAQEIAHDRPKSLQRRACTHSPRRPRCISREINHGRPQVAHAAGSTQPSQRRHTRRIWLPVGDCGCAAGRVPGRGQLAPAASVTLWPSGLRPPDGPPAAPPQRLQACRSWPHKRLPSGWAGRECAGGQMALAASVTWPPAARAGTSAARRAYPG